MDSIGRFVADAVLGIDTLWGGDVMCPSGTGRFIADSWFSDEPLPPAYSHPAAARMRETGGVSGKNADRHAMEEYLREFNVPRADRRICGEKPQKVAGLRGQYLSGLRFDTWDYVGSGHGSSRQRQSRAVRAVCRGLYRPRAGTFAAPERSGNALPNCWAEPDILLPSSDLLKAVDAWRRDRLVPMASVRALGNGGHRPFRPLSRKNLLSYLPAELARVPRANIQFLPIKDAWFSGSMNYIGRARKPDGSPEYEATYEINASLQISVPEFEQLISHEVVPGHVTTFAYLQDLYVRGDVGFEATVLTMNTRAATLFEGIANNAILIAHGVTEIEQLPDPDLQMGVLLALLQDDAKNESSYLTWGRGNSARNRRYSSPRFSGQRGAC